MAFSFLGSASQADPTFEPPLRRQHEGVQDVKPERQNPSPATAATPQASPAPQAASAATEVTSPPAAQTSRAVAASTADDKVGLTVKIDKALHGRLKIRSYRTLVPVAFLFALLYTIR